MTPPIGYELITEGLVKRADKVWSPADNTWLPAEHVSNAQYGYVGSVVEKLDRLFEIKVARKRQPSGNYGSW